MKMNHRGPGRTSPCHKNKMNHIFMWNNINVWDACTKYKMCNLSGALGPRVTKRVKLKLGCRYSIFSLVGDSWRTLQVWEADSTKPLTTIPLPPGTIYIANLAACDHQITHGEIQDDMELLQVHGLGPCVVSWPCQCLFLPFALQMGSHVGFPEVCKEL